MKKVSDFISHPSTDKDLKISKIFTDKMFDELSEKMKAIGWDGVDEGNFSRISIYIRLLICFF